MKAERGEENEKVDLQQGTKDFALRVLRMFASRMRRIDRHFRGNHQTYQAEISSLFVSLPNS
jgi:hypothetical protein